MDKRINILKLMGKNFNFVNKILKNIVKKVNFGPINPLQFTKQTPLLTGTAIFRVGYKCGSSIPVSHTIPTAEAFENFIDTLFFSI